MAKQKIVKGSDASIIVSLKDTSCSNDTCRPYPLTNFTGATGFFENEDGSLLAASGLLLSADRGRIQFDITDSQTELLKENDEASFVIYIDQGLHPSGTRLVRNVENKLSILARVF